MNISDNDKVNNFLADIQSISSETFDMVILIRDIFFSANKNLVEYIKYGGLAFYASDTLVGGIYIYKEHLSIEFSYGADFTDANSILEGGGKKRRHLKIYSPEDIIQKKSDYFIKQAV